MEKQNDNNQKILNILYIILAGIVVISFIFYSKLNNIEQKLDQINSGMQYNSGTYIDYSQIEDIVAEQLENQTYLNVQTEWSSQYKENKIYLDCSVILNQAQEDDAVKIYIRKDGDASYTSTELTKKEGLRYSGNVTLDLFEVYDYYVTLEGATIQSSKAEPIPREYYFIDSIKLGAEVGMKNGIDTSVIIYLEDPFTIKNLIKGLNYEYYRIDIYSNNKIIDSKMIDDVMDSEQIEILFEDYKEPVDKIVLVTVLTDGIEKEDVFYTNSDEETTAKEKQG